MGVDVADIDNDAYPEIISMDMLPSDPYILKRSLGEDTYDLFHRRSGWVIRINSPGIIYNTIGAMAYLVR
jgi:hypothetical protein